MLLLSVVIVVPASLAPQKPTANWVRIARSLGVAPTLLAVGVLAPLKEKSVPPAWGTSKSTSVCHTIAGAIQ